MWVASWTHLDLEQYYSDQQLRQTSSNVNFPLQKYYQASANVATITIITIGD